MWLAVGVQHLSPCSGRVSLVSATVLHKLGWVTLEFWAHFPVSVFQINVGVLGLQMWAPHLAGYMASGPGTQVLRLCAKSSFTHKAIALALHLDS